MLRSDRTELIQTKRPEKKGISRAVFLAGRWTDASQDDDALLATDQQDGNVALSCDTSGSRAHHGALKASVAVATHHHQVELLPTLEV